MDLFVSNCHDQKVQCHLVMCHLCDRVRANRIIQIYGHDDSLNSVVFGTVLYFYQFFFILYYLVRDGIAKSSNHFAVIRHLLEGLCIIIGKSPIRGLSNSNISYSAYSAQPMINQPTHDWNPDSSFKEELDLDARTGGAPISPMMDSPTRKIRIEMLGRLCFKEVFLEEATRLID